MRANGGFPGAKLTTGHNVKLTHPNVHAFVDIRKVNTLGGGIYLTRPRLEIGYLVWQLLICASALLALKTRAILINGHTPNHRIQVPERHGSFNVASRKKRVNPVLNR